MATKTKAAPAKLARPARARRAPHKSPLGRQLQAIADDSQVRAPCHTVVWSGRATDAVGISEGDGLYWGQGQMLTPQPISKRRMAKLRKGAGHD